MGFMANKDYSLNKPRIRDFIPFYGFINYTRRNAKENVTDSSNYASGFWHLFLMNTVEAIYLINFAHRGLEKLLQ